MTVYLALEGEERGGGGGKLTEFIAGKSIMKTSFIAMGDLDAGERSLSLYIYPAIDKKVGRLRLSTSVK